MASCDTYFDRTLLDFTPCGENVVVTTSLVALFTAVAVPSWLSLRSKKTVAQPGVRTLAAKYVLWALLAGLHLVQLVFLVQDTWPYARSVALLSLLVIFFAVHLTQLSFRAELHANTALLVLLSLDVARYGIKLRSLYIRDVLSGMPVFFIATQVLAATSLLALESYGPYGVYFGDSDQVYIRRDASGRVLQSPLVFANLFSRLLFSWMTPMMRLGYRKYLTEDDLWPLPEEDRTRVISQKFSSVWDSLVADARRAGRQASLLKALFIVFGWPMFTAGVVKFVQDSMAYLQPQLLRWLLSFMMSHKSTPDDGVSLRNGYVIAFLMFVSAVIQCTTLHMYFASVTMVGMRVRSALISVIYRKGVTISNSDRAGRATGDIINLMSTDTQRLQDVCAYGHTIWSAFFQFILAFYSLYNLLGWCGFVGIIAVLLSSPPMHYIARRQATVQKDIMHVKDTRTRYMSEILYNIRSIKLYAWEKFFVNRLLTLRNSQELELLKKYGILSTVSLFFWTFTPFLVAFSTFALFAITHDEPLTSDIIFPALALFQLLAFPLAMLPFVFAMCVEAWVSIKRMASFLSAQDLQIGAVTHLPKDSDPVAVEMFDASFSWTQRPDEMEPHPTESLPLLSKPSSPSESRDCLRNVSFAAKTGSLVALIGRVADGKSSVLSALAGELTRTSGSATVRGSVAYTAQSPWLLGATVRENILFGRNYDEDFYNLVLDACALRQDLEILVNGDQSEVGEKGITLSGGQKARISVARAVYANADVYLFDDPLSAVDMHVGNHLFKYVLGPEGLLKDKTRLLCTNAIQFLDRVDHVICLEKGEVVQQGTYEEVAHPGSLLEEILREKKEAQELEKKKKEEEDRKKQATAEEALEKKKPADEHGLIPASNESTLVERINKISPKIALIDPDSTKAIAMREFKRKSALHPEAIERGSVKWSVYLDYARATSFGAFGLYVLCTVLFHLFTFFTNVWLKIWAANNDATQSNTRLYYYLSVYGMLGLATAGVSLVAGIAMFAYCTIKASRVIHDDMFRNVMRAPMRFFELTPSGVILNRFSRDVFVIDSTLGRAIHTFFRMVFQAVVVVLVISFSTPLFTIFILPIGLVYYSVQRYYLRTSRELKRLDSTTRSPLFASFQETLTGITTIRAFGQAKHFIALNEANTDRNQEAYMPSQMVLRWLAMRLELLGAVVILLTASLAVHQLITTPDADAGLAGLVLSYAFLATQTLNWLVRMASDVENNIVSVERAKQYAQLETEAPPITSHRPPEHWPSTGTVEFKNVSIRYREDLPPVLRNLSFTISPGNKVGVIGRTGAGKSTITMALYRIVEAFEGDILIDGISIMDMGLEDLRSHMAIIPQDAQCFEGTLRENLDPTGASNDAAIWRALGQCGLKDFVSSQHDKLEFAVQESGSNLSAGQLQLLCLARALLRDSKVIVLDEATSSVDQETDNYVQNTIRTQFADRTVLIIAHRLNTIQDCDYVMQMEAGRLVKYGRPSEVLSTF